MLPDIIKNRLQNVGVVVNIKEYPIDILRKENHNLRMQLKESKEREKSLNKSLTDKTKELANLKAIDVIIDEIRNAGEGVVGNGDSHHWILNGLYKWYIFIRKFLISHKYVTMIFWYIDAFLIGILISKIFNIFF